jgi:uncharacterized protein
MHYALRLLLAVVLVPLGLAVIAWLSATSPPIERHATLHAPGAEGQRIVLLSDLHLVNAATSAARLHRIVDQVNALHPDLVLIAGDMIAGHEPADAQTGTPALAAELLRLKPKTGTVAVLGNHDHWTNAPLVTAALQRAGITVVENDAVRRGPFAIIGVGDVYSRHADLGRAQAAAKRVGGLAIYLTHSPDIAPAIFSGLVLAGHTHCGQVVLPFYGPITSVTRFGDRYQCGIRREGARTVITTGGTGTSVVPFRFMAPPDLWVLDVKGRS